MATAAVGRGDRNLWYTPVVPATGKLRQEGPLSPEVQSETMKHRETCIVIKIFLKKL